MLMEHNVLRSNWPPMGEHDYAAGSHPTVEQQHFPSLAPSFHSYAPYVPSAQRFKDDVSPRTFGSLYMPSHQDHQPHQSYQSSSSSNSSNSSHHPHYSTSSSGTLPHHHHHHGLPLSLAIPRPSASASAATGASKKASEEERKAKHREAQRRFVKRKKAEMVQLKQFAVELELQYQLLEVLSECAALERENRVLESDIARARDDARHSSDQEQASDDALVRSCSDRRASVSSG